VQDSLIAELRSAAFDSGRTEFVHLGGVSFTFAEALETAEAVARGLLALGLHVGDRVGIMAGNRPETLWTWLGANAARLIDVPFNAEARGRLLRYFVEDTEPRVLVGTEDYLNLLAETLERAPEFVISIGSCATRPFGAGVPQLSFDELLEMGAGSDRALKNPHAGETATIMYTSGTTGPSKGVMLPQRYYPSFGALFAWNASLGAGDVFYSPQPLFHIDPRTFVVGAVHTRTTLALGERFSVSRFWDEVREADATAIGFIGTMMWLLYKAPPKPDDAAHRVREAICSSLPYDVLDAFEARFGLRVNEGYGMTESVIITATPVDEYLPGRVGRAAPHLEVVVLDDQDAPVPDGEFGEICFRPNRGFTTMQGYWDKPAETNLAWRNLWFHTGDLGCRHPDGSFEFVGRIKDSIRRRGENVSAYEVEEAMCAHPDVQEAAAIGVASEVGEDDVAVLVVAVSGRVPDPEQLVAFVERDLPAFAVPRFIEVVDELPKTPSEKVAKGKVRERGITDAAWDANVALGRR
jgi:crotonobetaine/carnitine-CoA ligase